MWLPLKLAIRWRRALILYITEQAERHAKIFWKKHGKGGSWNSPKQDTNSEQSNSEELTSKTYRNKDRLRLFDMVITPTLTYACATWTLTKEHERMTKSTQTKDAPRHHPNKKKVQTKIEKIEEDNVEGPRMDEDRPENKDDAQESDKETDEGETSNTDCDQDSNISFIEDSDNAQDEPEIEEEEWINYMKRSTKEVEEQMKKAKITCWIETHRKMKWRLLMRIAACTEERWSRKGAEWNPWLETCIRTNRPDGRPRQRWEDEINEFLDDEKNEQT